MSDESGGSNLITDWHTDLGVGLRAMLAGEIVRVDCGISDEGVNLWAMIGHPF